MGYDRGRFDEIQAMAAGDLVHAMLVEFDPDNRLDGDEPGQPWQNGNAYIWALDRLNEIVARAAEVAELRAQLARARAEIGIMECNPQ